MLALHASGHIKMTDRAMLDHKPGRTALRNAEGRVIYPGHDLDVFERDVRQAGVFARMGESLAGVDGRPPIVWPDMKKLEAEKKAAHPMSEETKARLRAVAKPRNVGDEIARRLEGKTLPQVYEEAAAYLGEDLKVLLAKYKHLNPGQQRMVCGNRMRAKWKAENLSPQARAAKQPTADNLKPEGRNKHGATLPSAAHQPVGQKPAAAGTDGNEVRGRRPKPGKKRH